MLGSVRPLLVSALAAVSVGVGEGVVVVNSVDEPRISVLPLLLPLSVQGGTRRAANHGLRQMMACHPSLALAPKKQCFSVSTALHNSHKADTVALITRS